MRELENFRSFLRKNNLILNEYENVGPTIPKIYIVKEEGTYKEAPIELLSKINNLVYDMGGGETNYYPQKNIVIIDNIPVEEFASSPGEINGEKIYVEYNLNNAYNFPKANKIIISQLVYHLDNPESFARTVINSLKEGGQIKFFSDEMSKEDKIFLQYISKEYDFDLPQNLSRYRESILTLKKGKFSGTPSSKGSDADYDEEEEMPKNKERKYWMLLYKIPPSQEMSSFFSMVKIEVIPNEDWKTFKIKVIDNNGVSEVEGDETFKSWGLDKSNFINSQIPTSKYLHIMFEEFLYQLKKSFPWVYDVRFDDDGKKFSRRYT